MKELIGTTGTKTFECEHCGERSTQIGVMSSEDLPYYTLYRELQAKIKDLKLYVNIAIGATENIQKDFPESFTMDGMLTAQKQIQTKLDEIK